MKNLPEYRILIKEIQSDFQKDWGEELSKEMKRVIKLMSDLNIKE